MQHRITISTLVAAALLTVASTAAAATNLCSERYVERYAKRVLKSQSRCDKYNDKINVAIDKKDEAVRKIDLQIDELFVKDNPNSLGCKIKGVFRARCDARKREKLLHLKRESTIKKWDRKVQRAQETAAKHCTRFNEEKAAFDAHVAQCSAAANPQPVTTTPPVETPAPVTE